MRVFFNLQSFWHENCVFCIEKFGLNCIDCTQVDKLDVEAELDIKPGIQGEELNWYFLSPCLFTINLNTTETGWHDSDGHTPAPLKLPRNCPSTVYASFLSHCKIEVHQFFIWRFDCTKNHPSNKTNIHILDFKFSHLSSPLSSLPVRNKLICRMLSLGGTVLNHHRHARGAGRFSCLGRVQCRRSPAP